MKHHIPILDTKSLPDYRKEGVLVDRFSAYLEKHKDLLFPHRHSFYHFVVFTQASGSYTIDFSRFEAKPWEAYFMSPGQIHEWAFGNVIDGYAVNFNESFFQSFLLRPSFFDRFSFFNGDAAQSVVRIPEDQRPFVREICERLLAAYDAGGTVEADYERVSLMHLLMLFEQYTAPYEKEQGKGYNGTLLRNFRQLIDQYYAEKRLPKDYADMLFVTPNHLNALCKEYLGVQAGELIRNRVLLEAKRLLVATNEPVASIAQRLGFNDSSYFTKFFKKSARITPEEFRRDTDKQ